MIASIECGENDKKAAVTIAGEEKTTSKSLFIGMVEEIGIARIVMNAFRMYLAHSVSQGKFSNIEAVKDIFSTTVRQMNHNDSNLCNCPVCKIYRDANLN